MWKHSGAGVRMNSTAYHKWIQAAEAQGIEPVSSRLDARLDTFDRWLRALLASSTYPPLAVVLIDSSNVTASVTNATDDEGTVDGGDWTLPWEVFYIHQRAKKIVQNALSGP